MKAGIFMMPSHPPERDTVDHTQVHLWLVGSTETVAEKLRGLYEASGGFGTLLAIILDHSKDRAGSERSMRLLMEEVLPRVADLTGD